MSRYPIMPVHNRGDHFDGALATCAACLTVQEIPSSGPLTCTCGRVLHGPGRSAMPVLPNVGR